MFSQFLCRAGLVAGLALPLLVPAPSHAQSTGRLTGVVTDPTGGVIPGADLRLSGAVLPAPRSAVSDAAGRFAFDGLAAGVFRLRVALDGFQTRTIDAVAVTAGSTVDVGPIALEVGGVSATTHVDDSEPALVETSHAALGLVIPNRDLVELPLNGRNFTQLGTLMPGVIAPPAALGGQAGDATPGGFGNATGGFTVNGMRNQSNNFLVDGAPNNDTFNTGFVVRPPPDAIDEFRIFTHAFGPRYGRNAGAVVSVVTRAGSNDWRGSGWWFTRDDALEAGNRFAVTRPVLQQHQYGGALGGPLARDRTFAFGYYEGYRNRRGTTDTRVVPSAAQRAGDVATLGAVRDPLTGQPFAGDRVPAARLDPVALRLLEAYVPLPNQPGDRFTHSPVLDDRRHLYGGRVDLGAGLRTGLLGRVHGAWTEQRNPLGPANFSPSGNVARARLFDGLASAGTVVTNELYHEVRVSVNRIDARPNVTSGLDPRDVGFAIAPSNPAALGLPHIAVNGFFTLGDAQQPFASRVNEVLTIADEVAWTRGRHAVRSGLELRRDRVALAFINRPNGNFTFNGQYSGSALVDFLLGLPQQYRQASGDPTMDGHAWTTSLFVQDDWRASSTLTLSAGLRYERAAPFVERGDKLNAFHPGRQSARFPEAPVGLVYPGDPGVPRGTYDADGDNVAPRLGLVWDVDGAGGTVLRAGWGLFHDTLAAQGDFFQNGTLAPPFQPLTEVNYSPASPAPAFQAPLDGVTGGPTGFPRGLIFIGWGPTFRTPAAQHYHLSLQRELARTVGVEVAYVGSRARDLPMFVEVNPTTRIAGQASPGPRLLPAYTLVRPTMSVARAWYDALQASARIRRWRGLTALASYTWGHAIDHVSGLNIGGEPRPMLPVSLEDLSAGEGPTVAALLAREKGSALFDVRHRIVLSANYVLPPFAGRRPLLRHTLGGWSVNAILQAQTGFALTVTEPVDVALQSLTNRPDVTCDPNAAAPRTVARWFDTSCFTPLTRAANAGQVGNAGRGIVRGPGYARTDLSLVRTIALPRAQRVELRVEAFNLFDQDRLGHPGLSIGTPLFGVITSADDGRIVQLGVRWSWR